MKLLVEEAGSELAAELWDGCDAAVASRLAYPEVCAALAAASRNRDLDDHDLDAAEHAWDDYWAATRPVELTTTASEPNLDPFGREHLGLRLETTIDRNEFGVSWNAPNQGSGNYLGDDVKLVAELAFIKAAS